jgi:hypothetical protein
MPMDSKCAITMPLPEPALQSTAVTPTIEGSSAEKERARFARARAKADAERLPPQPNEGCETLLHPRSPLVEPNDVAPVVLGLDQTVDMEPSDVPGIVSPERT